MSGTTAGLSATLGAGRAAHDRDSRCLAYRLAIVRAPRDRYGRAMAIDTPPSPFSGEFFLAGEPGFEDACRSRVFNRRHPDRSPAAVLRAAGVADVIAGVRYAAAREWQVTVRAGGHSWSVWSVRDDALLIDLGRFTDIDYDPDTGIAVVGPAVRGGADLDPFLAARGRFFNGGHCPTVGLGGFLLQGGMGWNCRGWGWAAESIVAVDVVTADGQALHCDADHHPDLFWAARGAGPGFPAIVTAFHLQTRERFQALTHSKYVYPAELTPEIFAWLYDARWELDDTVELVVVSLDAGLIPELEHDGVVVIVDGLSFADTPREGARALSVLESCPVLDRAIATLVAAPEQLEALKADQERANPENHFYVVDNAYLAGERDEVVTRLSPAFMSLPAPKAFTIWFDMGRAPQRGLPDMALSLQTDLYFAAYLVGENAEQVQDCLTWIEARADELEPIKRGIYLGDSDLERRPAPFLSQDALARLGEVRSTYDPAGLFCDYLEPKPTISFQAG
jgi:FAD/FMN-containing dehydrogenase